MATGGVLYVHGAGNRAAQASGYAKRVREGLQLPSSRFSFSTWGEDRGPDEALADLAKTIPQALAAFPEDSQGALDDPYGRLKELAQPASGAFGAVDGSRDARVLLAHLQLGGFGLDDASLPDDHLFAAAAEVAASPELASAGGDPVEVIDAAVTAAIGRAAQRQGLAVSGAFGFDLGAAKAAVARAVMGSAVSVIGGWIGPRVAPAVSLWLSSQLAGRRREIMGEHILVAADVLFYQRHGAAIREHLREELASVPQPRVAIGHSLGGIILVDTLFGPEKDQAPDVALLVTFGSQSAFLASVGALDAVTPVVPWLNVWTKYDFVSFLAAGLWGDAVTDLEVDVGQGFPGAHDGYYDCEPFYAAVRGHPAAHGVFD